MDNNWPFEMLKSDFKTRFAVNNQKRAALAAPHSDYTGLTVLQQSETAAESTTAQIRMQFNMLNMRGTNSPAVSCIG